MAAALRPQRSLFNVGMGQRDHACQTDLEYRREGHSNQTLGAEAGQAAADLNLGFLYLHIQQVMLDRILNAKLRAGTLAVT